VTTIKQSHPDALLHFVGSSDGLENDLIDASLFDAYDTVQAGPLHGVNPLRAIRSLVLLFIGTLQSIGLFIRNRPQAIFLTGGWVGLPVALAGTLFRVPIIIFVPDIEPGLTLKVLGRFAKVITSTVEDTQQFYPGKKVVATGYPLREHVLAATRQEGIERFKLNPDYKTLLIFGGSRGARSINQAVMAQVESLLQGFKLQIIHVSGNLDWPDIKADYDKLPAEVQQHYQVHEYLHELGYAMAAADVVVSRAGASTLGEFPYFELPSVLVPYPYAWRYQKVNADWLVERGAAVRLDDENLMTDLVPAVHDLLANPEKLEAMRIAAAGLASENGAKNIADVIIDAAHT
jgi:UDP-N-acetylglucosamine--N-acetylmuramyl-(pentapeptide) pyrophosphoryl-undecaprenol N-acetylglucosamine transferase